MTIRVLIVDDHRMFREAIRERLSEDASIEVVGEAGDGAEALRQVDSLEPDILLLDIGLPDLNGIDLTRRLLKDHPVLKIIALTAYSERFFVEEMIKAGAKGYVVKTASAKDLAEAVKAVAEGDMYLSSDATGAVMTKMRDDGGTGQRPPSLLGKRELEVLRQLARGMRSNEIADTLEMAVGTVEVHRRNIMRKLGIHSAVELTHYAIKMGVIQA